MTNKKPASILNSFVNPFIIGGDSGFLWCLSSPDRDQRISWYTYLELQPAIKTTELYSNGIEVLSFLKVNLSINAGYLFSIQ